MDDLGLVEADGGRGEGVVVGIASAADGQRADGLCGSAGVADRELLAAAVAVVSEAGCRPAIVERLLEGVEDGLRDEGVGKIPAGDAMGEGLKDGGAVGEALVGVDGSDVGDPRAVGGVAGEVALDRIPGRGSERPRADRDVVTGEWPGRGGGTRRRRRRRGRGWR